MAPKTATKRVKAEVEILPVKEDLDEDIARLPDTSSDEGEDPSDIKGTNFVRGSFRVEEPVPESKPSPSSKAGTNGGTKKGNAVGIQRGTRSRNVALTSSTSSVGSAGSTKRKGEDQTPMLGKGQIDVFGDMRHGKKVKTKYGSKPEVRILVSKKKQKDKFKVYDQVDDSPQKSDTSKQLKVVSDIETSPESTPKRAKFKSTSDIDSPMPTGKEQKSLKKYDMDDLSDSDDVSAMRATKKLQLPPENATPEKQKEGFKAYAIGLEPDLISKAKSLIDKDRDELAPISQSMEEYDFSTMTQQARCPMCGTIVDPDEIRAYSKNGVMNIRIQEKFCRDHKTRTAQDDWEIKNYPTIDWGNLDTRIAKHHAFIKKLINGQHSYYRELMDDTVLGGKDRNLMKMTSNLTPGYYGARGLRIFSENIMRKFTPLLKKRLPHDPVMSARGFTAYVQSVLVPELVVRLIMEDMDVDVEKGREILADSVSAGELLNEEIKDVVTRKVVDSEGEDESD